MPSQFVTIQGVATWADPAPPDAHPEHPIVIPPPDYHPEHPIVIPDPPPIDSSGGVPTHPIYIPIYPAHPIELPPEGEKPPETGGSPPYPAHPIILPGVPTHPIYIPQPEPPADQARWVWTPYYGWVILPPSNVARPKESKRK